MSARLACVTDGAQADVSPARWSNTSTTDGLARPRRRSHLARNLASLRHARALTQEALAKAAAVPRSTDRQPRIRRRQPVAGRAGQGRAARSACRSTSCSPRRAQGAALAGGRGADAQQGPRRDDPRAGARAGAGRDDGGDGLRAGRGDGAARRTCPARASSSPASTARVNLIGRRRAVRARRRRRAGLPRQPAALVPERRPAGAGARRVGRRPREGGRLTWRRPQRRPPSLPMPTIRPRATAARREAGGCASTPSSSNPAHAPDASSTWSLIWLILKQRRRRHDRQLRGDARGVGPDP